MDKIALKEIREVAGATQTDVAVGMGFTGPASRAAVYKIESRSDWLMSTIAAYLAALGATAELVVTVNGEEWRFEMAGAQAGDSGEAGA